MKRGSYILTSWLLFSLFSGLPLLTAQTSTQRQIAITIDDLPAASPGMSGPEITEMTTKLLGTLRDQKVPAVGFAAARTAVARTAAARPA